MTDLQKQLESKILQALNEQRAKFNEQLASKDAEIASLKTQVATASARFHAMLPAVAQPKGRDVGGPTGGLARMANGIKVPSKG